MSKPLISPGQLIADGWRLFARNFKPLFKISAWFMVGPVVMVITTLLIPFLPVTGMVLYFAAFIANIILSVWTTIRLIQFLLAQNRGKVLESTASKVALGLFWAFVWIGIARFWATLGGFFLLVLPAFWLAVLFSFAEYHLVEDGKRGLQALAASADLVKGRWWGVFGRKLLLIVIVFVAVLVAFFAVTLLVGTSITGLMKTGGSASASTVAPLMVLLLTILQVVAIAVFTPLLYAWDVKLFHSLKDTRE
jgi:hypothetical protein